MDSLLVADSRSTWDKRLDRSRKARANRNGKECVMQTFDLTRHIETRANYGANIVIIKQPANDEV